MALFTFHFHQCFSFFAIASIFLYVPSAAADCFVSAIGDPGMRSSSIRVAFEAWNFCNEVGSEAPEMGSPRMADCADLYCPLIIQDSLGFSGNNAECNAHQKVSELDNHLATGDKFPDASFTSYNYPDLYAMEKELYLASLCEVHDSSDPWQFWMIMLKNGNFDTKTALCPENGKKVNPIVTDRKFPCFGEGCMNQPLVYHNQSSISSDGNSSYLTGSFYGTYDIDTNLSENMEKGSYFSVTWKKNVKTGSWVFSNKLITSSKYPWLMLYLRSDATKGYNGGYHYDGRGIMKKLPASPNFKVILTLDVKKGGGPNSQFYLVDIGSCWKNNGKECDGDVLTDVTRYSEMVINPATTNWCRANNLVSCPPYHISMSGEKIYRNNTSRFPYSAYHLYCGPGNGDFLEKPVDICDPYSNPQAQELVQILPHAEWAVHGYPAKKGDGWIGDSRTWELDVGALSSRLYFYQVSDVGGPRTCSSDFLFPPGSRITTSKKDLDLNKCRYRNYVSRSPQTAEWTVSDFDVLVPETDRQIPTRI